MSQSGCAGPLELGGWQGDGGCRGEEEEKKGALELKNQGWREDCLNGPAPLALGRGNS